MKCPKLFLLSVAALTVSAVTASACYFTGTVKCPDGTAAAGVEITATEAGGWSDSAKTDANGDFAIPILYGGGTFQVCIDVSTLPFGAALAGGQAVCQTVEVPYLSWDNVSVNWLLDGPFCGLNACWLTGGGALIDPDIGLPVAGIRGNSNGKTPDIAFGGNVYPGCSPTAGEGGSWNHVDRRLQLHFHGTDIVVVTCGNIAGITPGSTSPVTPYNFIDFQGVGWLAGIRGNKSMPRQLVTFYARCEDRNEPGSKGAKDGALVDRYYLQVVDGNGDVVIQVGSGNPPSAADPAGSIETTLITDGNLQLHVSSCDDPPTP
jgi:hypothetical protein